MLFTEQLAPASWLTGVNGLEAYISGRPAPRLGFFASGRLLGREYERLNDGFSDVPILLAQGTARRADGSPAVFRLPVQSGPSMGDSIDVAFPTFREWGAGATLPFNPSDEYSLNAKLDWDLGGGSGLDLSYRREREQDILLALDEIYNPDGFEGASSEADALTLGGYFRLVESTNRAFSLDLKAGYQRYFDQRGSLDPAWAAEHAEPALGFNFGGSRFVLDPDDWPLSETLVEAVRSGVLPAESLQALPGRRDLFEMQTLRGLSENLRLNPYGLSRFFPISGTGPEGFEYVEASGWNLRGVADWQLGAAHRIQGGAELALLKRGRRPVRLVDGVAAPFLSDPRQFGVFATERLDLGFAIIEGGLRWDYFDSDLEYPRVPGFVFNVPDSLKADFVSLEAGEGPLLDRVSPLLDCGGEATAEVRTRPDGTLACTPNFTAAETNSELSAALSVDFPVTSRGNLHLAYFNDAHLPMLSGRPFAGRGAWAGGIRGVADDLYSLLSKDIYSDLQSGTANTRTPFGRDVDPPRIEVLELAYRQLIGRGSVVDFSVFRRTLRDGLATRVEPFVDPTTGGNLNIAVLTNSESIGAWGANLRFDQSLADLVDLKASYAYVEAGGLADTTLFSDPLLRRNAAQAIFTGEPFIAPHVILPLEESRHFIAATLSIHSPTDMRSRREASTPLSDFGFFATLRLSSGSHYTRLQNSGTGLVGPPQTTSGLPAERRNASRLPWVKQLEFRLSKTFHVFKRPLRLFADWRNPFDFSNTHQVYLETGTVENDLFREVLLNSLMRDALLDNDATIDDFDILAESPENELNKFALLQAERRYGDGDGLFTVEEQRAAFGAWYDLFFGPQWLRESNQSFRLGIELSF